MRANDTNFAWLIACRPNEHCICYNNTSVLTLPVSPVSSVEHRSFVHDQTHAKWLGQHSHSWNRSPEASLVTLPTWSIPQDGRNCDKDEHDRDNNTEDQLCLRKCRLQDLHKLLFELLWWVVIGILKVLSKVSVWMEDNIRVVLFAPPGLCQ